MTDLKKENGSTKRKRKRAKLWREQEGRCKWCNVPMTHWNDYASDPGKRTPEMQKLLATIDHLRDRYDPKRWDGNPNDEKRWVLACWECNHKRGCERTLAVPIEERRLASRAYPRGVIRPPFVVPAMRNKRHGPRLLAPSPANSDVE